MQTSTLHDLFREPAIKPLQVEPTSILELADLVMQKLLPGARTRYELTLETGASQDDVSRAINYLLKSVSPPFIEILEATDTRTGKPAARKYYLSEFGRKILPPPSAPDWHGPDVDPRKSANERHVHGLVGKIRVHHDGSLDLKGQMGKIYDCLKYNPGSSAQIAERTGLPANRVQPLLSKMLVHRFIEYDKNGKASNGRISRRYFIPGFVEQPVVTAEKVIPERTLDYLKENAKTVKEPDYEPAKDESPLTLKIRELMQEHQGADILLTIIAEYDRELQELRKFKQLASELLSANGIKTGD